MQKVQGSAGGRKRRDVALKMRGPLRQMRERHVVVQRQRRSATARLAKLVLVGVKMDDEVEQTQETGGRSRGKMERRKTRAEATWRWQRRAEAKGASSNLRIDAHCF